MRPLLAPRLFTYSEADLPATTNALQRLMNLAFSDSTKGWFLRRSLGVLSTHTANGTRRRRAAIWHGASFPFSTTDEPAELHNDRPVPERFGLHLRRPALRAAFRRDGFRCGPRCNPEQSLQPCRSISCLGSWAQKSLRRTSARCSSLQTEHHARG